MNLEKIVASIGEKRYPPVDQWNPEFCGDIDITIQRDGRWFHEGGEIKRPKMVNLFASILKREGDEYFLVTPVEKMRIKVEATPFIVVEADLYEDSWVLTNNLGEKVLLDREHPIRLNDQDEPEILWRSNIPARVNQNLMYQWQMHALDHGGLDGTKLMLTSAGQKFVIGQMEDES